jgi:dihydropyrimidinase
VLPDGPERVDIGINNGVIAAIGPNVVNARRRIDAREKLVLPGGVDSHCHMDQQPWEGRSTADDFRSGTLSALCGGNTTVIPFAMQMRGQSLREVVDDYHERARHKAHIDYGFHLVVGDPTPKVLTRELPDLIEQGCTSIKIFLTYEGLKLDDYEVLTVLDLARQEGVLVMVHAENDACVRWLTAGSRAADICRDLPAISFPVGGRYRHLRYERSQVRMHAATARSRQPAGNVAGIAGRHAGSFFIRSFSLELCG